MEKLELLEKFDIFEKNGKNERKLTGCLIRNVEIVYVKVALADCPFLILNAFATA